MQRVQGQRKDGGPEQGRGERREDLRHLIEQKNKGDEKNNDHNVGARDERFGAFQVFSPLNPKPDKPCRRDEAGT
jgi:hypothetical protein